LSCKNYKVVKIPRIIWRVKVMRCRYRFGFLP